MLEEGVVPCSFTTVFSESAEVTGGKVVVTDSDMSSLSPGLCLLYTSDAADDRT